MSCPHERSTHYYLRLSELKISPCVRHGIIKHKRNYEEFSSVDFIAQITQHIPDTGAQMVRYYGWYSNKSRGLRAKRAGEKAIENQVAEVQIIDVSDYQPRRIASKKWRELIKKVWEVDPLICPHCQGEMKMIALIDDAAVVSRILKHMGLWPKPEPVRSSAGLERGPPVLEVAERVDYEHYFSDPIPNYDACEVVFTE